jgi:hypothetical protein
MHNYQVFVHNVYEAVFLVASAKQFTSNRILSVYCLPIAYPRFSNHELEIGRFNLSLINRLNLVKEAASSCILSHILDIPS